MVKKPVMPLVLLACSMVLASCDTTPPTVSTLMSQVAQAVQNHDKEALRACYAREGVTADQIDQQLGQWDMYLTANNPWTYTGIRYVSIAAAAHDSSILPETVTEAQGTTLSGIRFAPNIKVVGFVLVSFKLADGSQSGVTEPVGYDSDGSAKFALTEPQH